MTIHLIKRGILLRKQGKNKHGSDPHKPVIASKSYSLPSADYVPALCTYHPSLLPMNYIVKSLRLMIIVTVNYKALPSYGVQLANVFE